MDLITSLCAFLNLSVDGFLVATGMLLGVQAFVLICWLIREIKRPSPVDELMRERHYGGV